MEAISLLGSSVALRTADVTSIPALLCQSTRNVHTELFSYQMQILREVLMFSMLQWILCAVFVFSYMLMFLVLHCLLILDICGLCYCVIICLCMYICGFCTCKQTVGTSLSV